ncbi:choice-of-anchor I family protein [Ottowia thiooxydans]|uniref:Choice-of-anchor I domain-containing protein n=1 Tax=Ottowia thiooxydans TaxID=219182 RepID=A0ABV2QCV1_9BURK
MPVRSAFFPALLLLAMTGCGGGSDTPAVEVPAPRVVGCATDSEVGTTPTSGIKLSFLGRYASGTFLESAAEIPAFDAASKRGFIVNAKAGELDVLDLANPAAPTKLGAINASAAATAAGAGASPAVSVNSVAAQCGVIALAIESSPKTNHGFVSLYDAKTLELLGSAQVGALPDMVTFTPDGKTLLVANEGEPNADYSIDPEGSVSVVDLTKLVNGKTQADKQAAVRTADFKAFNGQEDGLRAQGVRIFGPKDNSAAYGARNLASAAQDFEPEYIAVSGDGTKAWVTLQENNAFAEVDVANARITAIRPLGFKDYGVVGNEIDASDEPAELLIKTHPGVKGVYMPDAVASYTVGGKTFLVTANEGDARAWGEDNPAYWGTSAVDTKRSQGFVEEFRVKHLVHNDGFERRGGEDMPAQLRDLAAGAMLDPAVFGTNGANCMHADQRRSGSCRDDDKLGRLNVTWTLGYHQKADGSPRLYNFDTGLEDASLTAADPKSRLMYHTLYSYGARSFAVWDDTGSLMWDSGSLFEKFIAENAGCKLGSARLVPCAPHFNTGHDEYKFDSRSDAKGPEPEGVTIGRIGNRYFAFIGLERMSGVMVYDVTDPKAPVFQDYLNTRENWGDQPADAASAAGGWAANGAKFGDLGPEGLAFVPAHKSPNGKALLIVGHEVSGTTTIYQVQ